MVRLLLILDTKYEEDNARWWVGAMSQNLDVFYNQILTSAYVSPEVIEEKIFCSTYLFNDLLNFSCTLHHRESILLFIKQGAHLIIDRIQNQLLTPLSLSGEAMRAFTDQAKMNCAFNYLQGYQNYVGMLVRAFHIHVHTNTSYLAGPVPDSSQLEKLVKHLLSQALKLSQVQVDDATKKATNCFNTDGNNCPSLGIFMWQHVVFELVGSLLGAYTSGIKHNIKTKVDNLLIPEDIFTIGSSLMHNLINFKPVTFKQHMDMSSLQSQAEQNLVQLLIDNDLTIRNLQEAVRFNYWSVLANLIYLFNFDQELFGQVSLVLYPQVATAALDFMEEFMQGASQGARTRGSNWTRRDGQYNQVIFAVIRDTYLPLLMSRIQAKLNEGSSAMEPIQEYHNLTSSAWNFLKALRGVFELEALHEFLGFAFNQKVLEQLVQIEVEDRK